MEGLFSHHKVWTAPGGWDCWRLELLESRLQWYQLPECMAGWFQECMERLLSLADSTHGRNSATPYCLRWSSYTPLLRQRYRTATKLIEQTKLIAELLLAASNVFTWPTFLSVQGLSIFNTGFARASWVANNEIVSFVKIYYSLQAVAAIRSLDVSEFTTQSPISLKIDINLHCMYVTARLVLIPKSTHRLQIFIWSVNVMFIFFFRAANAHLPTSAKLIKELGRWESRRVLHDLHSQSWHHVEFLLDLFSLHL